MDRPNEDELFRIPKEKNIPVEEMSETEIELRKLLAVFSKNPEDSDTLYRVSRLFMNKGLYEESWLYLDRYLRKVKDDSQALNWAGIIHFMRDENGEAESFFEKALALDNASIDALYNSAMLFFEQGRFDESVERFRRLIALESDNPENFNNLGAIIYQSGDSREAEELFRRALDLDPDNSTALNNLLEILEQTDRYDEAKHYIKSFEERNPSSDELMEIKGRISDAPSNYDTAEQTAFVSVPAAECAEGRCIGIVSDWCPGDRGEMARWLYTNLARAGHTPHVFTWTGTVPHCKDHGRPTPPWNMGGWAIDNLVYVAEDTVEASFEIWMDRVKPDAVVFVDTARAKLVEAVHASGARAIACPAYVGASKDTPKQFVGFDRIIAATPWIYEALQGHVSDDLLVPSDLGIDLKKYAPASRSEDECVFMFDAGHGSVEDLENLLVTLTAFGLMTRDAVERSRLMIRTSVDWHLFPDEIRKQGEGNQRIELVSGCLEDTRFLTMGHVLIHLRRAPGVHWIVPEAFACATPSIVLEPSPATCWIFDQHMALKIPRAASESKEEHGRTADVKILADTMSTFATDPDMLEYMGGICRDKAVQLLDDNERGRVISEKIVSVISSMGRGADTAKPIEQDRETEIGSSTGEELHGSQKILAAIEDAIAAGNNSQAQELISVYRQGIE